MGRREEKRKLSPRTVSLIWRYRHNLPPDVEALFTKQPPIKDVIEFALGEEGAYFVSYRDADGAVYCRKSSLFSQPIDISCIRSHSGYLVLSLIKHRPYYPRFRLTRSRPLQPSQPPNLLPLPLAPARNPRPQHALHNPRPLRLLLRARQVLRLVVEPPAHPRKSSPLAPRVARRVENAMESWRTRGPVFRQSRC